MCKKLAFLVSIVVVLGMVGSALGVAYTWSYTTGDYSWCTASNWNPATGVPGVTDPGVDDATISNSIERGPRVPSGCNPDVNNINGPDAASGKTVVVDINSGANVMVRETWDYSGGSSTGTVIINIHGNLTIDPCSSPGDWYDADDVFRAPDSGTGLVRVYPGANVWLGGTFRGADSDSSYYEVFMYGGDVNCGSFKLGDNGSGNFYMTGGRFVTRSTGEESFTIRGRSDGTFFEVLVDGGAELIVGGSLRTPQEEDATALINLDDGYIECKEWGCAGENWILDINEGILRVKDPVGTKVADIQGWIDAGQITGYNGTVTPIVTTDGDDIVVTVSFVHLKAYDAEPIDHTTDLCPGSVQLSWTPGIYCVDDHNLYFGTSLSDVNESATPYKAHHDSNSWTPPYLEIGTTYFWRVDEVNDACNASPWTGGIWQFTTENGQAYDPSPGDNQRNALPGSILRWTPCCVATSQNFYYGADFPESIVLFDDGFEAGVDPNWTPGGWVQHDATSDSNYSHSGSYSAKAVDATVKTLTSDDVNASDYANALQVSFWVRRTEDVNDMNELKLYYYNGTGYDYVNDFNVVALGPNDAWHEFTDTITDSNYLISNFRIRLVADLDAGDTVYVDDVTITNTWPVNPIWLEAILGSADNNYPDALTQGNNYYWRIDTVVDGNLIQGDFWNCEIGVGGLIMYYNFNGGLGGDLPSPITDNSGNNIKFWKYPGFGGSLTYGEPNPVIVASTPASADFDPCVGLYRPGQGEFDPLRLAGWQYTIEMWVRPQNLSEDLDVEEPDDDEPDLWLDDEWDIVLIGKFDSWMIGIQDPCDSDAFRWEHAGNGETMEDDTAVEGEWAHLAVVYDRTNENEERMKFYLNGVLKETTNEDGLNPADNNYPVTIGYAWKDDVNVGRFFDGLIDEVRIYDIALTPCDFLLFPGVEWASCPSPYNGEAEIDPCTVELLKWTRGQGAVNHDIYFSSDFDDVNNGTALVETSWAPNSWTPPETPGHGTVYFWRIDTHDVSKTYQGVVWQFTTQYIIEDPHLILHYKFDETMGDRALDASGHGYHGDVDDGVGGWDPAGGQYGGCRIFADDTAVFPPLKVTTHLTTGVSVSVWLNGQEDQQTRDHVILDVGIGENADYAMRVVVPDEDFDVLWRAGNDSCDVMVWDTATPAGWEGDWHHLVFTKDETAGTMKIYFDGFLVKEKDGAISTLSNLRYRPFKIGAYTWHGSDYEGKIDDLRIYDYAIPESKVLELFRGGDLAIAWKPKPYDGRPDAPPTADLSWESGDWASSHEVYFGTNKQEVTDANNDANYWPDVYKGKQELNTYELPPLDLTVTYYWRIDEVNDPNNDRWTGKVWRFRVADYIVVDNFDDDTTEDPPTDDWVNGNAMTPDTGASLSLRSTPPVIGEHSMRYAYDNWLYWGAGYYSETQTQSLEPNDWDYYDIRVISLWFYGQSGNAATIYEQMNLGLEDDSNYAVVWYGGPGAPEGEEMTDVQIEEWQLWEVLTNRFTNINFRDVKKICIGFGFRNNVTDPGLTSLGVVFFDEINLYVPTCRPEILAQEADLNEDCTVDWEDVEIMADDWLDADVNLNPVQAPGDANLVAWWKLDEAAADTNIATDYAGDNNGVIETLDTDVFWADAGHDGNALRFDGGRVLVPDANALKPKYELTVCAWIKYYYSHDNSARVVVKGADNKETFALEVDGDEDTCVFLVRDGNDPDEYENYDVNTWPLEYGDWVHLAGTFKQDDCIKVYKDGQLENTNNDANAVWFLSQETSGLAIGNRSDDTDRQFEGYIDDVRVYNRTLSAAEIAYIATDETGIFTVQSAANIYNLETLGDRIVNSKDYAKLADNWLKKRLWPE